MLQPHLVVGLAASQTTARVSTGRVSLRPKQLQGSPLRSKIIPLTTSICSPNASGIGIYQNKTRHSSGFQRPAKPSRYSFSTVKEIKFFHPKNLAELCTVTARLCALHRSLRFPLRLCAFAVKKVTTLAAHKRSLKKLEGCMPQSHAHAHAYHNLSPVFSRRAPATRYNYCLVLKKPYT
ncbi:MAG: hypothetical protein K0Q79_3208 [Flavipsychrobacter sp.]|jgi:hypothetical protein|nr:hypothetical protein [Flavipsychrobacter sp.]